MGDLEGWMHLVHRFCKGDWAQDSRRILRD